MTKIIALAVGMTGTFYGHGQGEGQRAEITRVWSETCVNLKINSGADFDAPDPTSVFVPPLGIPADRHPAGYYFLPDVFLGEALRQEEVDSLHKSDLADSTGTEAIVQTGASLYPRVMPADVEANIVSEHYFTAAQGVTGAHMADIPHSPIPGALEPLTLLTFCVIVLRNGFTCTGESACVSPENFNGDIGRKIARANAFNKIWPLMGYALKEQLAHGTWISGTLEETASK